MSEATLFSFPPRFCFVVMVALGMLSTSQTPRPVEICEMESGNIEGIEFQ